MHGGIEADTLLRFRWLLPYLANSLSYGLLSLAVQFKIERLLSGRNFDLQRSMRGTSVRCVNSNRPTFIPGVFRGDIFDDHPVPTDERPFGFRIQRVNQLVVPVSVRNALRMGAQITGHCVGKEQHEDFIQGFPVQRHFATDVAKLKRFLAPH